MTITGTVVNGLIVPDKGMRLPEGTRCNIETVDEHLPADHPMAPFDVEHEVALIRKSIESGDRGVPHRQVFEEIYRENGLGPLPPR